MQRPDLSYLFSVLPASCRQNQAMRDRTICWRDAGITLERHPEALLKTAKALADEQVAQVLGYLKSARLEHGLLINFGSYKFEMLKLAWSQDAARRKSKPA